MPRKKAVEAAESVQAGTVEKAAKKTPSILKKAAPEKVEEIYLQAGGTEWNISDCKDRAVAAYVAEGHRASGIKKLVVYLKPEEGKAYYVVNDGANGSIDL